MTLVKVISILQKATGPTYHIKNASNQRLDWGLSLIDPVGPNGPRCVEIETHGPIESTVKMRVRRNVVIDALHMDKSKMRVEFLGRVISDGADSHVQGFYSFGNHVGQLQFLE